MLVIHPILFFWIGKKDFLKNNNLFGVDRVVPIGQAMDINIVWDGYDVVKSLSRAIELK